MDRKYTKKLILFIALAVLILSIIILLYFISPEEIVKKIGVQDSYILLFFISLFGGFSAGGSISFITLLITLAIGGLNPFYLGIISGVSLAIGDMIMFYAGSKGRELIRSKWDRRIEKITKFFKRRKWLEKLIPYIAYFYIGFTPLPNDVLLLFLAGIEFPAKKMNTVIILGDMSFTLTLAILASKGIKIIN